MIWVQAYNFDSQHGTAWLYTGTNLAMAITKFIMAKFSRKYDAVLLEYIENPNV